MKSREVKIISHIHTCLLIPSEWLWPIPFPRFKCYMHVVLAVVVVCMFSAFVISWNVSNLSNCLKIHFKWHFMFWPHKTSDAFDNFFLSCCGWVLMDRIALYDQVARAGRQKKTRTARTRSDFLSRACSTEADTDDEDDEEYEYTPVISHTLPLLGESPDSPSREQDFHSDSEMVNWATALTPALFWTPHSPVLFFLPLALTTDAKSWSVVATKSTFSNQYHTCLEILIRIMTG